MKFTFDEEKTFTMKEYFDQCKDDLPEFVIVTGGYYGLTIYDDYASDQVIRFHTYSSQPRVVARDSSEAKSQNLEFLSIPVDSKYKFRLVTGLNKVGPVESMSDILQKSEIPVLVKFAYRYPDLLSKRDDDSDYVIIKEYKENYLLGNCILNGEITSKTTIAALTDNIEVAKVTGIKGRDEEQFKQYLSKMDEFVRRKCIFDEHAGNPAIAKFHCNSDETGTGASIDRNNPLVSLEEVIPGLEKTPPPVPVRHGVIAVADDDHTYDYIKNAHSDKRFKFPIPATKPKSNCKNKPPDLPPRPTEKGNPERNLTSSKPSHTPYANDIQRCVVNPTPADTAPFETVQSDKQNVELKPSHVGNLSIKEVGEKLRMLNLDKFVEAFAEDMIDGTMLQDLNVDILKEDYKFKNVEAMRLLKYVETGHVPQ